MLNSCPSNIFIFFVLFSVKLPLQICLYFVFTVLLSHFIFLYTASLPVLYFCLRTHCKTLWQNTTTFISYLPRFLQVKISGRTCLSWCAYGCHPWGVEVEQLGRRHRECWGGWFRQQGSGQALPSCGLRVSLCGLSMCTRSSFTALRKKIDCLQGSSGLQHECSRQRGRSYVPPVNLAFTVTQGCHFPCAQQATQSLKLAEIQVEEA